ncbi:MAG: phosphate starvation-inducible protein PhoH [Pelagibacteraceae bacterium]|nr:phosphate starvation-inducible protein PhoH [Pelagibacteraceae bacterium]OUV88408.1 MAG: phosphate starvation-inducible protein PhoH [Pelagibacteraceae bacterium TMED146]RZO93245.1 MAG: PhoH family protein [alpha proteobacterium HIMB114]
MTANLFQIIENDSLSTSLYVNDNKALNRIVGVQDTFLKVLETLSGTVINLRGNLITIKGDNSKSKLVINTINQMLQKSLSKELEEEDVKSLYHFESSSNNDVLANDVVIKTPRKNIFARTEKQKTYINNLAKNNIIFSLGPAGTGKTYLAVAVAVSKLMSGEVKKIILSRPAVEAGENLGFLPGDLKEKIDPYLIPLYDSLYELVGYEKMQKKIEDGTVEIAPLAFMRGRTLKDSFVILDEAQNATDTQIKMFLTRLGKNTTMVVNGDPSQIDLPGSKSSGLLKSINILDDIDEIKITRFDTSDVQRHPLVSKIIDAYKKNQ